MGIWMGPRGKAKKKLPPKFTTDGVPGTDYLYAEEVDEGTGIVHWELAILRNCTLRFQRLVPVDVFLVGGGRPGLRAEISAGYFNRSGAGGNGGECKLLEGLHLAHEQDYAVTVGGSGESTALIGGELDAEAISGGGSAGGSRASIVVPGVHAPDPVNTAGADGVYAFGEAEDTAMIPALVGRKYGAGGGGGHALSSTNVNTASHQGNNAGGATGGGAGGTGSHYNGYDGAANTGGGGGGGFCYGPGGSVGSGGAGGTGIVIIRDARG